MRGLLTYIAFTGVLLGLARLPFLAGCAVLVVGVVAANLLVPTRLWRSVVYGGIAGVGLSFVTFLLSKTIERPHRQTRRWYSAGATRAASRSQLC